MHIRQLKTALALVLAMLGSALHAAQTEPSPSTDDVWESFVNPSFEMKPRALWFWNGSTISGVPDATLEEIVEEAEKSGYNGLSILPAAEQSIYLTESYFQKYGVALEKARQLGMKMTLYDEYWYPSSRAGGVLGRLYPEYTVQRLDKVERNATGPGVTPLPIPEGHLMGLVAMNNDTRERFDLSTTPGASYGYYTVPGAHASSDHGADYTADRAFDGNPNTRWNAAAGATVNQWLEACFATPQTFDNVTIREALGRITSYAVQYWDENSQEWKSCHEGTTIGRDVTVNHHFPAVTSIRVRLLMRSVTDYGASIGSFDIYNGAQRLEVPQTVAPGIYSSSNVDETYSVEKMFDGRYSTNDADGTRWNAASENGKDEWILLSYTHPVTFDRIKLCEAFGRITKYSIQYWENEQWKDCYTGGAIGNNVTADITFPSVTSRMLRFYVNEASASPSIWWMEVYNGPQRLPMPRIRPVTATVSASSVFNDNPSYGASKAFDGSSGSRWNAADGTNNDQWLMVEYNDPVLFDRVVIREALGRITSWSLQYWAGNDWANCSTGTVIGNDVTETMTFSPVISNKVRFYVHSNTGNSASIWFMDVYDGETRLPPQGNEEAVIEHGDRVWNCPIPDGRWKVMAFVSVLDASGGMNYLDAESVDKFIKVTHQAYYDRFSNCDISGLDERFNYFGTVIDSTFYDEPFFWNMKPESSGRMWTHKFNDDFVRIHGYCPILLYPAMFMDIGEETEAARAAMNYVRAELYSTEYIKRTTDWCNAHGILSTGHVNWEEYPNPAGYNGDLIKVFKYQDIPGIDYIFGYGWNQLSAKVVSSAAYNWDKPEVMCEIYGGINNMDEADLYRIAMDQFTKGINYMIPHAIWTDTNKVVFKPELSSRDPVFGPLLPELNNYMGRAQLLLKGGRHVADIGVLYPIDYLQSCYLFNSGNCNPSDNNYMNVGATLADRLHRDYTFVHPEVLEQKCTVNNGSIRLNNAANYEEYRVFILPGMKMIRLETARQVEKFHRSGGSVISIGQLPYKGTRLEDDAEVARIISGIFDIPEKDLRDSATANKTNTSGPGLAIKLGGWDAIAVGAALDSALNVYDVKFNDIPVIDDGYFGYIHKVKDSTDIYFIGNSSRSQTIDGSVDIRGKKTPVIWNPHDGTKSSPHYSYKTVDGITVTNVKLDLEPVQSVFIIDENAH